MSKLDGKVVIVTGSARGIGKGIALYFGTQGAKVVSVDRDLKEGDHKFLPGSAETTVSEIKAAGGTALAVRADVSLEEECTNAVAKVKEVFGPVDVLVNDAAFTHFLAVKDYPAKKWFRSFAVNVCGPFMMGQKVLPDMIKRHKGAIINITSASAIGPGRGPYQEPPPKFPATMYGAEKAAIERFTQGFAQEVYQYGVTVAALAPSQHVWSPGTDFLGTGHGPNDPNAEPVEFMAKAAALLATEPLEKVAGRVTYSQAILKEFGLLAGGAGPLIDSAGSGFSKI